MASDNPDARRRSDVFTTLLDFGDFTLEDLHHQLSQATIDLTASEGWLGKDEPRAREYLITGRRTCDIAGRILEHMIALRGQRLRRFSDPEPGVIVTGRGGPMDRLPIILTSRQHRLWCIGSRMVETAPGEPMPELERGSDRTGRYDPHPSENYGDWTPLRLNIEVC